MASWTLVTEADRYVFERSDGLARYIIYRHGTHWHAEQFFPYSEDVGHDPPRQDAEQIRDWYKLLKELEGDTVTVI